MNREGTTLGGKYRVVRLVGEGGMGAVYEVEHVEIRRRLAVKVLRTELAGDAGALARFRQEALAAGSLGHDHICAALDVGTAPDGAPYFVMELLRGESIAEVLAREGRFSPRRALSIAAQVLDALACAHAAGVVHRDLKPENVFLARMGEQEDFVRVLDFGVSKVLGDEAPAANVTGTGRVVGTPHYMAPEQARGQRDQDHRVDVYAAGVLLYEMATGRRPFEGESFHDLIVRIATDPFPSPRAARSDLSPEYEAIVLRAVARQRGERFPDARSMRLEVLRVRDSLPDAARAPSLPRTIDTAAGERSPLASTTPSDVERPRPKRSWAALAAAAAVVALALGAFALGSRNERAPARGRDRPASTAPRSAAAEAPAPSTAAATTAPAAPRTDAPIDAVRPRRRPRPATDLPTPAVPAEKLDFAR